MFDSSDRPCRQVSPRIFFNHIRKMPDDAFNLGSGRLLPFLTIPTEVFQSFSSVTSRKCLDGAFNLGLGPTRTLSPPLNQAEP